MHDIGGSDMSDEERQWIADDISASLIAARDRSIKEATGSVMVQREMEFSDSKISCTFLFQVLLLME